MIIMMMTIIMNSVELILGTCRGKFLPLWILDGAKISIWTSFYIWYAKCVSKCCYIYQMCKHCCYYICCYIYVNSFASICCWLLHRSDLHTYVATYKYHICIQYVYYICKHTFCHGCIFTTLRPDQWPPAEALVGTAKSNYAFSAKLRAEHNLTLLVIIKFKTQCQILWSYHSREGQKFKTNKYGF